MRNNEVGLLAKPVPADALVIRESSLDPSLELAGAERPVETAFLKNDSSSQKWGDPGSNKCPFRCDADWLILGSHEPLALLTR